MNTRQPQPYNIEQIYKWWHVFQQDGKKFCEVRVISNNKPLSGYFSNIEVLISEIKKYQLDQNLQVYFTLNSLNDACYDRMQKERLTQQAKQTTSDNDVVRRDWIMLDFDPKRPAGVGSSDEELAHARQVAGKVYEFLLANGFYQPVTARSGNGYHILVPVQLENTKENTQLVVKFLNAIAMLFDDIHVGVDLGVFNASRICKLYGTEARKGSNSDNRPWRLSEIVGYPETIVPNDIEYIKKIASMFPEEKPTPSRENNFGTEKFDIENFFAKHNIQYRKTTTSLGSRYILQECPFDSSHKDPDSMVFQHTNGALAFSCFHNSCSQYTWKDFRLHFEPDAYDQKSYNDFRYKRKYNERYVEQPKIKEENEQDGKKWLQWSNVVQSDDKDLVAINSGIHMLDKYIKGFVLGELSILCGLNGSGKSTLLNTFALNAIQRNYKVAYFSGELRSSRLKQWIAQVAAGKQFVTKVTGVDNAYEVKKEVYPMLDKWISDKLLFYNHEGYGNVGTQLLADVEECINEHGVKFILIDNLMSVNLDDNGGSENKGQKNFVINVSNIAKKNNVHVVLVVHPRKETNMTFLRKESVKGAGDITDAADNLLLAHRVGNDFDKRATEFLGKDRVANLLLYDNVIEIAKNRDYGNSDKYIGLYFEPESRRYKNSKAEQIHYGWEESPFDTTPKTTIQEVGTKSQPIPPNTYFDSLGEDMSDNPFDVYEEQFRHDTTLPF